MVFPIRPIPCGCGECNVISTPWNEDQVKSLNAYQQSDVVHPFTCGCGCGAVLIATSEGWKCPNGGEWHQNWCFEWMVNWGWQKFCMRIEL